MKEHSWVKLKKQRFSLSKDTIFKTIISIFFLYSIVYLYPHNSVNNETDIIQKKIEYLENEVKLYKLDKELWSSSLDRSNSNSEKSLTLISVIFGVLNISGYLVFFQIYQEKMNRKIKNVETKFNNLKNQLDKLDADVCRSVYFSMISNGCLSSGMLWGLRFLIKEFQSGNKRKCLIDDFLINIDNLTSDTKLKKQIQEDHEMLSEIINSSQILKDIIEKNIETCSDEYKKFSIVMNKLVILMFGNNK